MNTSYKNSKAAADPIKIAFIRSSAIGDVVISAVCIPYLLNLKKSFGACFEVYWIGTPLSMALLPDIDLPVTKVDIRSPEDIEQKIDQLDLVVDFQRNLRSSKLLGKLRQRYGCNVQKIPKYRTGRFFLVLKAHLKSMFQGRNTSAAATKKHQNHPFHIYKECLKTLRNGLFDLEPLKNHGASPPELDLENAAWWAPLLSRVEAPREIRLAVGPGASYPTKKAPTDVVADILQKIKTSIDGRFELELVLVGDKNDSSASSQLLEKINWPWKTLDLCGKTNLNELAKVLESCSAALCNDSSISHISESVGTDVAVLFGPTSQDFGFSPRRPSSASFSLDLNCRPCSKHGKKSCRYQDQLCFQKIDTSAVAKFIVSILSSSFSASTGSSFNSGSLNGLRTSEEDGPRSDDDLKVNLNNSSDPRN